MIRHVNLTLLAWLMRKHKNLARRKTKAARIMYKIVKQSSDMFIHWKMGKPGGFAGSRAV